MDAFGVAGAAWGVAKDLYTYYQAVKHADDDIKDFRIQLLSLQTLSDALTTTLKRDGADSESHAAVDAAISRCSKAATELREELGKIKAEEPKVKSLASKLKTFGRKSVPFKKETVSGLAHNVKSCQDGLQLALNLLGVNIGARSVENIRDVDDKIVAGVSTLEAGLEDLKMTTKDATDAIQASLDDAAEKQRAQAILSSLKNPELQRRWEDIPDADEDQTRDWLLAFESQEPQIANLLSFLQAGSGLFWILGKPASGKSVFTKFLADPARLDDLLEEQPPSEQCTIASHWFWTPGTKTQNSLQGMLQSLLHQVLKADPDLVKRVCPTRWTRRIESSSWSVNELRSSLQAAVAASDRRIDFFIDGLDECQPETEHGKLVSILEKLASYKKSRLVVSSRPWKVFEPFSAPRKTLCMESVNNRPILTNVRSRLKDVLGRRLVISEVQWDCECARGTWLRCKTLDHSDAHYLAQDIIRKADGNFLWVKLVLDAVCKQLQAKNSIPASRNYVRELPKELEEYFKKMILDRMHGTLVSDTAMALKIALDGGFLCDFWMLRECSETGESMLVNPDFVFDTPITTHSVARKQEMILETMEYLDTCCRDLLRFESKDRMMRDWRAHRIASTIEMRFRRGLIEFSHRTVFDFLQTTDMLVLLRRHAPEHFFDASFAKRLEITRWKLVTFSLGFDVREDSIDCIKNLSRLIPFFTCRSGQDGLLMNSELIAEVETVATFHVRRCFGEFDKDVGRAVPYLPAVCCGLTRHRLYNLTKFILEQHPELLINDKLFEDNWNAALRPQCILYSLGIRDDVREVPTRSDTDFLAMLLDAGANPDRLCQLRERKEYRANWCEWSTPWRAFLQKVVENEQHAAGKATSSRFGAPTDLGTTAADWETFSDANTQHAIKLMLDSGVSVVSGEPPDLAHVRNTNRYKQIGEGYGQEPEVFFIGDTNPLFTLKTYLPRDSELYDWQSILDDLEMRVEVEKCSEDADAEVTMRIIDVTEAEREAEEYGSERPMGGDTRSLDEDTPGDQASLTVIDNSGGLESGGGSENSSKAEPSEQTSSAEFESSSDRAVAPSDEIRADLHAFKHSRVLATRATF
ncbi:hypothetical protein MBLNU230_g3854t1 [Neophaeotheca triangularis]